MDILGQKFASLRPFLMFECTARLGSFSNAAKAFNVSQPSVTRNIAKLEHQIGVQLFKRGARGSDLTDEGRELFHAITQGLGTISEAITRIAQRKQEDEDIVRLSVSNSFVSHWMAPRLAAFTQEFPQVRLHFHLLSGLMDDLPQDADLAIRVIGDGDTGLYIIDFAPEIVLPVCAASYRALSTPDAGQKFLHFSGHPRKIWQTHTSFGRPGDSQGGVCHEFDDYSVLLQAALDGSGIALGWLSVTSKLLIDGRLVPAGGTVHRTGRMHRLISTARANRKPVVPRIAEWLADTMRDDLDALTPVLGAP